MSERARIPGGPDAVARILGAQLSRPAAPNVTLFSRFLKAVESGFQ